MSIGIGDTLREAREAQGRTQQDAAQSLRVRSDQIDALENEDFAVLGADIFARGHLRHYADLLGLDTAALLATYDRYVRTEDQTAHHIADAPVSMTAREPLPQWVVVLGAAVMVLGAIALVGLLGNRTPPPASPGIAVGASPTPSATAADASAEPSQPSSPSPSPTPTFDGVEMLLVVEADCWMAITVDGQAHPRSNTVVAAGETLALQADNQVHIRYGNAGGVIVEVNGQPYGRPGGNGEVVEVTYGPQGPIGEQST